MLNESLDSTEIDDVAAIPPERFLWLSVIEQALRDVRRGATSGRPGIDHRAAKAWIGTWDFFAVCDLAGMDPAYVMDQTKGEG